MIARDAGLDLIHVPYNGGGPLMTALMGNQVSSAIDTLVDQIELQRAGKIRILASAGAKRAALLPEVPTFAESRLEGRGRQQLVRDVRAGAARPRSRCGSSTPPSTGAGRARAARALCQARAGADRRQRRPTWPR